MKCLNCGWPVTDGPVNTVCGKCGAKGRWRVGAFSPDDSPNQCAHGQQTCDACTDAWSAERRMLVSAIERMKAEVRPIELAALHAKEDAVLASEEAARLLAACQSLHRAWRKGRGVRKVMQDAINAGYDRTSEVIKERDALRAELATVEAHLATAQQVAHMGEWARRCIGCSLAARLLRACQSLHRAWRHEAEMRGLDAMALAERDALRAEVERLLKWQRAAADQYDAMRAALAATKGDMCESCRRNGRPTTGECHCEVHKKDGG